MILKREKEREERMKAVEETRLKEIGDDEEKSEFQEVGEEILTDKEEAERTAKVNMDKDKNKNKKKEPFSLPWWCKVVAYFLSILFSGISLFFIVIKGIALGDEMVSKWLTSLLSSFFSSVFLTQPVQVNLMNLI